MSRMYFFIKYCGLKEDYFVLVQRRKYITHLREKMSLWFLILVKGVTGKKEIEISRSVCKHKKVRTCCFVLFCFCFWRIHGPMGTWWGGEVDSEGGDHTDWWWPAQPHIGKEGPGSAISWSLRLRVWAFDCLCNLSVKGAVGSEEVKGGTGEQSYRCELWDVQPHYKLWDS